MRETMLILHFIGLAMGLGTSFAMMFMGVASGRMEPARGREFMLNALVITRMGQIGLVLLFISGGYLLTPYAPSLSEQPLLIAKLVLFVVLAALIGILSSKARKARTGDAERQLASMVSLGRFSLITALVIVVLAVLVFN